MPLVLTETASVSCAHAAPVQLRAGQSKLTVGGARVLVAGDLVGAAVTGCTNAPTPSGNKPCLATTSAIGGLSTRLRVGGRAVVLETVGGLTDGVLGGAPQPWSVKAAGQTKLKTL